MQYEFSLCEDHLQLENIDLNRFLAGLQRFYVPFLPKVALLLINKPYYAATGVRDIGHTSILLRTRLLERYFVRNGIMFSFSLSRP